MTPASCGVIGGDARRRRELPVDSGRARDPEASFERGCDSMAYLDNAGKKD